MMQPSSISQLVSRLPLDNQRQAIEALDRPGTGVAIYGDDSGPKMLVTFGARDSDIPNQSPPMGYGDMILLSYCPARNPGSSNETTEDVRMSPVKAALTGVQTPFPYLPTPQVHYPKRGVSKTEHAGERERVSRTR